MPEHLHVQCPYGPVGCSYPVQSSSMAPVLGAPGDAQQIAGMARKGLPLAICTFGPLNLHPGTSSDLVFILWQLYPHGSTVVCSTAFLWGGFPKQSKCVPWLHVGLGDVRVRKYTSPIAT